MPQSQIPRRGEHCEEAKNSLLVSPVKSSTSWGKSPLHTAVRGEKVADGEAPRASPPVRAPRASPVMGSKRQSPTTAAKAPAITTSSTWSRGWGMGPKKPKAKEEKKEKKKKKKRKLFPERKAKGKAKSARSGNDPTVENPEEYSTASSESEGSFSNSVTYGIAKVFQFIAKAFQCIKDAGVSSIFGVGMYKLCLSSTFVWSTYALYIWTLFYNILLSFYEFWGRAGSIILYGLFSLVGFAAGMHTGKTLLLNFKFHKARKIRRANLVCSFFLFCAFMSIQSSNNRMYFSRFSYFSFLFSSVLCGLISLVVFVNVEAFNEASLHFSDSSKPGVDLASALAHSSGETRWPFKFKGDVASMHLMLVARRFDVEEGMAFWGYETIERVRETAEV